MNKMIIAVDGPSGVGKSFLAKSIANKLNISYLDTGAMYRCYAYYYNLNNIDITNENILKYKDSIDIEFKDNNGKMIIFLNGKEVTDKIREHDISMLASNISKNKLVREILVEMQRKISENTAVVLDGRDIASVVFPNADYKFYIDCDIDVRVKRRSQDYIKLNKEIPTKQIKQDMIQRDIQDKTREISPLIKVSDAILIDTSKLTKDEMIDKCLSYIKNDNK